MAKSRREYRGGATRENHNSTLLLSRVAAVGALAGGPCSFGWAHFAVAVVVLVIDASSWQMANMNDRTCASARVSNFRLSGALSCGWTRSARGRRTIYLHVSPRAWVSRSRVCTYRCTVTGYLFVSTVDFQTIVAVGRTPLR